MNTEFDNPLLDQALTRLRAGHPVAIPTETVYGLSAPIGDASAIRRIFELKQRPFFDPLIVHIADFEQLQLVAICESSLVKTLASAFWPGPLTLVLPKLESVNPMICSGLSTVGVRMPDHSLTRELIRKLGQPLAAPSANMFGKTSPTCAAHVEKYWTAEEVLVVDGGPCRYGIESTVLGITGEASLTIYRQGSITPEMLRSTAGPDLQIDIAVSSAAPGHTEHHYMPELPLIIVPEDFRESSAEDLQRLTEVLKESGNPNIYTLELDQQPEIAARTLYAKLHAVDISTFDVILVHRKASYANSNWAAIWDRLERAATLELD